MSRFTEELHELLARHEVDDVTIEVHDGFVDVVWPDEEDGEEEDGT